MSEGKTPQTSNTRYVYIEMVLDEQPKYDVISGLLKMVFEKKGDTYIALHSMKDSVSILNLKFYNIMTIEHLDQEYKNMVYLTCEQPDQYEGLKTVKAMYDDLMESGFGVKGDVNVVDIEKYRDVPEEYLAGAHVVRNKIAVNQTSNGNNNSYKSATTYNKTTFGNYTRAATIKKDPEPSMLCRTADKKPNKATLALMEEKINQIKEGVFVNNFPDTAVGSETEIGDDEHNIYGNYFGMG